MTASATTPLPSQARTEPQRQWTGLVLGALGVLIFSFSLPATRAAAPELGGYTVGLGRAIIAGVLALIVLAARRERFPGLRYVPGLAIVTLGVIIGFPVLTSLALQSVNASHGAIMIGISPAMTAVMAVLRGGERPPLPFWISCGLGVIAILLFALSEGQGQLQAEDLLLLGAVILVALGYAEGGKLSRELGGWRVICWALVLALPFLTVPVWLSVAGRDLTAVSATAWWGFGYVSVFSMFLGFFAWYAGLGLGGIARVSQVQLVQPILTLVWSSALLGEPIKPLTIVAALLVIVSVALTQWVMRRYRTQTAK
jgi:drug/metabolite transporter (DMT)-like permease